MDYEFRVATVDDVPKVLAVLDEAAEWLRSRGVRQWPARFDAGWIMPAIARGETQLVTAGGELAATVTLDWSDPLWDGRAGDAGYIHRMAVCRSAAGTGGVLLSWAAETTLRRGRTLLRLDCVAGNDQLRRYYESAGFRHRGDVPVAGAPGQRLATGNTTIVSRYELPLPA